MATTASLDWLQTLADGTRVRLLCLLETEELSVSELCAVVQLPQSTVSRHLKLLGADEWIASRREGTTRLYRIDVSDWDSARSSLWEWVRSQADSPTTTHDRQRLSQVLAQRSRSEAFFSSSAEHWDSLRLELFGQQLDSFVLAATMPEDAIVGDLGCGSAAMSQLIAPYVKQVFAVDSSTSMLAAAKQRLSGLENVNVVNASLTDLPIEDEKLDAAWLVLVLPYLDDPEPVLREAARVLKSAAPLVVVDLLPHERVTYQQEMGHVRLGVDKPELNHWLDGAGLTLTRHVVLPPDPLAKGPALFAAVLKRI